MAELYAKMESLGDLRADSSSGLANLVSQNQRLLGHHADAAELDDHGAAKGKLTSASSFLESLQKESIGFLMSS